jgi:uncharacterized protein YjbI with pentapeptide repeats
MTASDLASSTQDFTCACEEGMRSACKDFPFYNEFEGKRYCVLHYPSKEKKVDFQIALQQKLDAEDFDFRGAWFPSLADFNDYDFTGDATFASATFSTDAYFVLARFGASADFTSASFNGTAYFTQAVLGGIADFSFATFNTIDFISATFVATAYFMSTTFKGDADFTLANFKEPLYLMKQISRKDLPPISLIPDLVRA